MSYDEYLASDVWKYRRELILSRAGRRCERCGTRASAWLEVHHVTYERFGNERLDDLEALCPRCHDAADKRRKIETTERAEEQVTEALETIEKTAALNGFNGWAEHVFGKEWRTALPFQKIVMHYLRSRRIDDPMSYTP